MSARCNNFYAKICRVCLLPKGAVDVKSLVANREDKFDVFHKLSRFFIKFDSNENDRNFNEMLCLKDAERIKALIRFIEMCLDSEHFYFRAVRGRLASRIGRKKVKCDFNVCRVCLAAGPFVGLAKPGDEDKKILTLLGLKTPTSDDNKAEAYVMCRKCSHDLNAAQGLIVDAQLSEKIYIEARVDEKRIETMIRRESARNRKTVKKTKKISSAKKQNLEQGREEQKFARCGFKCEVCGKILTAKGNLKQHLESIHVKIKKFACGSCIKTFYHKNELDEHVKRNHEKKRLLFDSSRPFKCSEPGCNKFFQTKIELNRHYKAHSDERPFACWCQKSFKFLGQLKAHEQRHEKNGYLRNAFEANRIPGESNQPLINGYPCSECGKVLSSKSVLHSHINSFHSKIKKFSCDICLKKFAAKKSIETHIINVHINKGKRPFKCDFAGCERRYSAKSNLRRHEKSHIC